MNLISFSAARSNQRTNRASLWYAQGKKSSDSELYAYDRLGTEFINLHCVPKFNLPADGAYFMIGSCFARGLENVLAGNGFDVRSSSKEFERFGEAVAYKTTPLGATNRYNTGAILNEFRWALEPAVPFPEDAIVDIGDGVVFDPHMNPTLRLSDRATTLERRRVYTGVAKELAETDVVIITLGLVETWLDTRVNLITNVTPDPRIGRADPERFLFKRLGYMDNLENLEAAHAILARYGKPGQKIIVTVSPVPLLTTFTTEDVIVANAYSKNTLRAVATDFAERHANVDYFPSYEMVMNADLDAAWIPDRRHVKPEYANQIMRFFIKNWISGRQDRQISAQLSEAVY